MPGSAILCTIGDKCLLLRMEDGIMTSDTPVGVPNIQDARPTFERAIEESNLELLSSLFLDDAWMLPPNHPILKGKEAILEYYKGMLSVGHYEMKFEVEELDDFGDLAVEVSNWVMEVKTADTVNHVANGKSMVLWRKGGTGWQIMRDMFSSNNPED